MLEKQEMRVESAEMLHVLVRYPWRGSGREELSQMFPW